MNSILIKTKDLLKYSFFFKNFKRIIGGNRSTRIYVEEYIKAKTGDRILDIGCGNGDILNFLPSGIFYYGLDMNSNYIEEAKKKFYGKGNFINDKFSKDIIRNYSDLDIVMANGFLHHLTDDGVNDLFVSSFKTLKEGGRLITIDGCYSSDNPKIVNLILKSDRGEFVRNKEDYSRLARQTFKKIKISIRKNLLFIPYCHIIMECTK